MKMIIAVALALVAVAAAAPAAPGELKIVEILRSSFVQNPDGSYDHAFESEDGIKKQETGELKEALDEDNKPHTVVVVRGAYSYPGEDGKPIEITYYADENGFHAEGASIPKQNPQRR